MPQLNKYKSWTKVPGKTAQKKWDKLVEVEGELAAEVLRRMVLADPEVFVYGDGRAYAIDNYELGVVLAAKYFTTVRNVGRSFAKDRREFPTLARAIADADGDPRVLVYGVASDINSTALSRKYFDFYKAVLAAIAERGR